MSVTSTQPDYHRLVEKIRELPTLPDVLGEVNRLLRESDSGALELEEVMRGDQSLTMTVLRVANSAYYTGQQRTSNLRDAIATLGLEALQRVVLSTSVISLFGKISASFFNVKNFWQHSIGVAVAASTVGKLLNVGNLANLYTCGLLHDIGKVANFMLDSEGMRNVIKHAHKNKLGIDEAENTLGFPSHARLGFHVSERWNLPKGIGQVICNHHETDPKQRSTDSFEYNYSTDIIILANAIVKDLKFGFSGDPIRGRPCSSVFERLQLGTSTYDELVQTVEADLENAHGLLDLLKKK